MLSRLERDIDALVPQGGPDHEMGTYPPGLAHPDCEEQSKWLIASCQRSQRAHQVAAALPRVSGYSDERH
jgi:hypothetical protein